jgi:hypothetical protein
LESIYIEVESPRGLTTTTSISSTSPLSLHQSHSETKFQDPLGDSDLDISDINSNLNIAERERLDKRASSGWRDTPSKDDEPITLDFDPDTIPAMRISLDDIPLSLEIKDEEYCFHDITPLEVHKMGALKSPTFKVHSVNEKNKPIPSRELDLMQALLPLTLKNFDTRQFEDEDSPLSYLHLYDYYFILMYLGKEVTFSLNYRIIQLYREYAWMTPNPRLLQVLDRKEFTLDHLQELLLPKLFSLSRGYICSYFHLCLDHEDFEVLAVIFQELKLLGKRFTLLTTKQFQKFVSSLSEVNTGWNNLTGEEVESDQHLSKEELISLLLLIYRKQCKGVINVDEEHPDVVRYFFHID